MFSILPYILLGLSLGFFSTLCTSTISSEKRVKFAWMNSVAFIASLVLMQLLGHDGIEKEALADFVMSGALSGLFIGSSLFNFNSHQIKRRKA